MGNMEIKDAFYWQIDENKEPIRVKLPENAVKIEIKADEFELHGQPLFDAGYIRGGYGNPNLPLKFGQGKEDWTIPVLNIPPRADYQFDLERGRKWLDEYWESVTTTIKKKPAPYEIEE